MKEIIDKAANNDYVLIGLIALLVLLVIIFFIVLLFGGKKKEDSSSNKSEELSNTDVITPTLIEPTNLDFDHEEYVKETTAEFELTPLEDIKPAEDEALPVVMEESPTRKVESINPIDQNMVNTFNFEELSRMISEELDKVNNENSDLPKEIKEEKIEFPDEHKSLFETLSQSEDVKSENRVDTPSFSFEPIKEEKVEVAPTIEPTVPEVKFVDSFKEIESTPTKVEVEKPRSISDDLRAKFNNNYSSVFLNNDTRKEDAESIGFELPKLAEEKPMEVNKTSEPVIKEEDVPLFERFNQETYDINKKD